MRQRKILVTGSSGSIGRKITELLLSKGFTVVGIVRKKSNDKIRNKNYFSFELDFSVIDNLVHDLKNILAIHSDIDGFISCSGYGDFRKIENFSTKDILKIFNVNIISQIIISSELIPILKIKKFGNIIFIGSDAALKGSKNGSLYCSTKFGIRGFSQSIREECASSNIKVTLLNLGMVDTKFYQNLKFKPGKDISNHINIEDISNIIFNVLISSEGTVFDEINISPQKKVINFK